MERSQVAATGHQLPTPDFRELSRNMAQLVEEAGKAAAAYLKPTEERRTRTSLADEVGNMARAFGRVAEQWLIDPGKTAAVQRDLGPFGLRLSDDRLQAALGSHDLDESVDPSLLDPPQSVVPDRCDSVQGFVHVDLVDDDAHVLFS